MTVGTDETDAFFGRVVDHVGMTKDAMGEDLSRFIGRVIEHVGVTEGAVLTRDLDKAFTTVERMDIFNALRMARKMLTVLAPQNMTEMDTIRVFMSEIKEEIDFRDER